LCARFQADPKESHLKAVKRIFRYLKGSDDLCLTTRNVSFANRGLSVGKSHLSVGKGFCQQIFICDSIVGKKAVGKSITHR